jgi:Tfp pilus assembly pilus retraction ATPase PilT
MRWQIPSSAFPRTSREARIWRRTSAREAAQTGKKRRDRVERQLEGLIANTLRSVQALEGKLNNDVVAIDPIGDDETAEEVVRQGARSGRLLLATLLETDAASAVEKLARRSGRAAELVRALRLVVAQRLVRRLCDSARERP